MQIDLNADVGEGCSCDAELIPLVSSVNIACGGHAGDAVSMQETVRMALAHDIAIGAHPSYPDREHFGRRPLTLSPKDLRDTLLQQIDALAKIVEVEGARLRHIKPHGALYNQSADDPHLAELIAQILAEYDKSLILVGLANSEAIRAARHLSIPAVEEAFIDRRYQADGRLVPRENANALLSTTAEALQQCLSIVQQGRTIAINGETINVHADTVCIHGDTPQSLDFTRTVRQTLLANGYIIAAPSVKAAGH